MKSIGAAFFDRMPFLTSTTCMGYKYNKLFIGNTFWKSIALPSLLYGTNIINLIDDNIRELQTIENSVYRCILEAAHYSPNVTLRGELRASLMRKRVINGRINYIKDIKRNRND